MTPGWRGPFPTATQRPTGGGSRPGSSPGRLASLLRADHHELRRDEGAVELRGFAPRVAAALVVLVIVLAGPAGLLRLDSGRGALHAKVIELPRSAAVTANALELEPDRAVMDLQTIEVRALGGDAEVADAAGPLTADLRLEPLGRNRNG